VDVPGLLRASGTPQVLKRARFSLSSVSFSSLRLATVSESVPIMVRNEASLAASSAALRLVSGAALPAVVFWKEVLTSLLSTAAGGDAASSLAAERLVAAVGRAGATSSFCLPSWTGFVVLSRATGALAGVFLAWTAGTVGQFSRRLEVEFTYHCDPLTR
jgi:hypothetical protein